MKVYVDELPKDCIKCSFCEKYGYYLYCIKLCEKLEYFDKEKDCPLKLLTDRIAEERKRVVQEIRKTAQNNFEFIICDECYNTIDNDVYISSKDLTKILDQIEGVSDEQR